MQQCFQWRSIRPRRLAMLWLLLAAWLPVASAASSEWRWDGVARVVAMSDVHGAYGAFVRTLQASELVDSNLRWTGGQAHLVVTGDLLDRGADSRPVMDLLMRLEGEAAVAEGYVHVLLGNHEVMNLVGDLRYVADAEYAAFADDETAEERERWFAQFLARAAAAVDPAVAREQFDRARPPGFFAHRRAFRADGVYGRWLLEKPLIIAINGTAFVHGGLSPVAARLGLAGMNRGMGDELAAYVRALAVLNDAALLLPGDGFYTHARVLAGSAAEPAHEPAVTAAISTVMSPPETSIHQADGPLWYRGQAGCPTVVGAERLTTTLQALQVDRVVVGHTPTAGRRVVSRFDGLVIGIDTGMLNSYYHGTGHALHMDRDALSVINEDGELEPIADDPRLTGLGAWTATELEGVLRDGEVSLGETRADGTVEATVTLGDQMVNALYYRAAGKNRHPEVAAYRLDRLLGLDMVPVTVRREVNGKDGALQLRSSRLVDEARRAEARAGNDAWCPLPAQWPAMYLFDALIQQPGRSAHQILYDPASWKVVLVGHEKAFGTRGGRPAYLKNTTLEVTATWRAALGGLSAGLLEAEFSDVLDTRRQKALLQRRDELLEGG